MSNYKDWIKAIDIEIDYFSAFMKAWIAFNAWYESGEIVGNTDKDKIETISSSSNRYRNYMNNLLIDENSEGLSYKEYVAKLHEALLGAAITTQEYIGVKQQISFSEVSIKNLNSLSKFDFWGNTYEGRRAHGRITLKVTCKSTNVDKLLFEYDEYNVDVLQQQADFQALSISQKEQCLKCYSKFEPYIIESVLDSEETAKKIGAYGFVNDVGKISRAIIKVLYLLRCSLAHGDISPDEPSNQVYKYAYEVLIAPLKKLV